MHYMGYFFLTILLISDNFVLCVQNHHRHSILWYENTLQYVHNICILSISLYCWTSFYSDFHIPILCDQIYYRKNNNQEKNFVPSYMLSPHVLPSTNPWVNMLFSHARIFYASCVYFNLLLI